MRAGILALVLASLAFAPAPLPRPARTGEKDDLARLQGTWEVVERRKDNIRVEAGQTHMTLDGTRWTATFQGEVRAEWELTLHPTASPRALDLRGVGNTRGFRMLAVYRLEGDRLTIAYSQGTSRPVEADLQGRDYSLLVLRRPGR